MSKNENLNYSLNDRIECYHNQVIYPSAYYPPPALSHVSTNVPNLGSTNCDIFQSFNKHPASAKIMKNVHSVTTYVSQEEVILEAAKMENWRPVNVSFWHKPQPPVALGGTIGKEVPGATSVNCGAHHASSCGECTQVIILILVHVRILTIKGHGKEWCHGECLWAEEICIAESSSVMKREEGPTGVAERSLVSKREEGPTGVKESSIGVADRSPVTKQEEGPTRVKESSLVSKREEGPTGANGSSPVTSVNCGAHLAFSCRECPQVIIG